MGMSRIDMNWKATGYQILSGVIGGSTIASLIPFDGPKRLFVIIGIFLSMYYFGRFIEETIKFRSKKHEQD
jgi:hypothetical protein